MTNFMPLSPNGGIENGAYLNATSDFFLIYTLIGQATGPIGAANTGDTENAASDAQNLWKLMETVQTLVNAKYINVSSAVVDLSVAGNRAIYNFGTDFNQAATTVYTIKFMAEQPHMLTVANLTDLLEGNSAIVYNPTTGVPSSGGPVTLSAYELTDAAATNTSITLFEIADSSPF